ncbi:hypothetical protein CYMTET_39594 [Cymbomonas tetramitiformis]|uniref:Ubiquitin-like domain-containing protein n=1 Tax=Cymbomonas tetramitiformis TaxID=36881 RepID=A0AAE0F5F7_9CHLO|nr:hypothetical protein CYMTET_39594 [Cymbomonas tetramitiformis]|eukprot:gene1428-2044_t
MNGNEVAYELTWHYCEFMYVVHENFVPNQDHELSPPPMVDLVWHEHILDTRGYQDFCNLHFREFIHHNANGALLEAAAEREIRRARTSREYARLYKEYRVERLIADGLWWSRIAENSKEPSITVSGDTDTSSVIKRKRAECDDVVSLKKERNTEKSKELFEVQVRTLTGRTITFPNASPAHTISSLADKVHEEMGVPLDQMRLINKGRVVYGLIPIYGFAEPELIGSSPGDDLVFCVFGFKENPRYPSTSTFAELEIDSNNNQVHMVLRLGGC